MEPDGLNRLVDHIYDGRDIKKEQKLRLWVQMDTDLMGGISYSEFTAFLGLNYVPTCNVSADGVPEPPQEFERKPERRPSAPSQKSPAKRSLAKPGEPPCPDPYRNEFNIRTEMSESDTSTTHSQHPGAVRRRTLLLRSPRRALRWGSCTRPRNPPS